MVEFRHLIVNLGMIFQSLEAVCDAFGDVEHLTVVGAQLDREPIPEWAGFLTQIHDHIVYGSSDTPHQLDLLVRRRLVVHAAKSPLFSVVGGVALNEDPIQAPGLEFPFTEGTSKRASVVLDGFRLDKVSTLDFCFDKDHFMVRRGLGVFRHVGNTCRSQEMGLGDRDYEFSAPTSDVTHLFGDFVFQVPWKDEHVVGPRFPYLVGCEDRYA